MTMPRSKERGIFLCFLFDCRRELNELAPTMEDDADHDERDPDQGDRGRHDRMEEQELTDQGEQHLERLRRLDGRQFPHVVLDEVRRLEKQDGRDNP